jgi:2-polyprenyl-3-methyl-5-hydroxy-6-metoxy-1,4-benzoquinol methylase
MRHGQYAHDRRVADADLHRAGERRYQQKFRGYVDLVRRFAPPGKLLDIGCGTGMLINLAQERGIETEGIELTADRLKAAQESTGATVHDRPIEALGLASESFAAVTMINVFSHLTSPTETFSHVRRVLRPGGILLLQTGEIGTPSVPLGTR